MPAATAGSARTLYDKLWDEHVVAVEPDGTAVLYVDRHLVKNSGRIGRSFSATIRGRLRRRILRLPRLTSP